MTLPGKIEHAIVDAVQRAFDDGMAEEQEYSESLSESVNALRAAILAWGEGVREGALREAAEAMERALNAWCVSSTDGRSVDALVRDTLASLASRPEPERARCPCGHSEADHRSPVGCGCLELCAPEPAPEGEGAPIVCPRCSVKNWDRIAADAHAGWCAARPSPRSETTEDR